LDGLDTLLPVSCTKRLATFRDLELEVQIPRLENERKELLVPSRERVRERRDTKKPVHSREEEPFTSYLEKGDRTWVGKT
jgi:hypothetical protein